MAVAGVGKTFPGRPPVAALSEVSLAVGAGECVAILGPSGCGKTTLLRILAGLERPDAGRVRFGERDVTGVAPERRGVGFVFAHDALFGRAGTFDNVAFGLRARGVRGAELAARVRAAAARTRCDHLLARSVAGLSGGERQRVALARALATDPAVLLLDEPLSRLDATLRGTLRRELADLLRARSATTLYVTHDQAEALVLGDRIAVMRAGRIAQIGTARELFACPVDEFVASSLGQPAIALVPAAAFPAQREPGVARFGFRAAGVRLDDASALRGRVRAVEDLLEVAYVYVDGAYGTLVARVDGTAPNVGADVGLALDWTRALRFGPGGARVDAVVRA